MDHPVYKVFHSFCQAGGWAGGRSLTKLNFSSLLIEFMDFNSFYSFVFQIHLASSFTMICPMGQLVSIGP